MTTSYEQDRKKGRAMGDAVQPKPEPGPERVCGLADWIKQEGIPGTLIRVRP